MTPVDCRRHFGRLQSPSLASAVDITAPAPAGCWPHWMAFLAADDINWSNNINPNVSFTIAADGRTPRECTWAEGAAEWEIEGG